MIAIEGRITAYFARKVFQEKGSDVATDLLRRSIPGIAMGIQVREEGLQKI
jgi:hypothetical protein